MGSSQILRRFGWFRTLQTPWDVRAYLRNFQEECEAAWADGSTSTEMATRPLVHDFIKNLAQDLSLKRLLVRHDTAISGTGNTPDWRIYELETNALFAFGDQKNLKIRDSNLRLSDPEKKQIERYRKMSDSVFVFDGIRMLVFDSSSEEPKQISLLLERPTRRNLWHNLTINENFFNVFSLYFTAPSMVRYTENLLIRQVAYRSVSLRSIVLNYLDSYSDLSEDDLSRTIQCFSELQIQLSAHHSIVLEDNIKCADFLAQVISFGLLYAHSFYGEDDESPAQRLQDLQMMAWDVNEKHMSSMGVFVELSSQLTKIATLNTEFSNWLNEISQFFSFAGYLRGDEGLDFHTLFEQFLHEYDPEMQFEFGAFYTPNNVSDWMVRASFELMDGNSTNTENTVKIIDPCCGTGSFIESILDRSENLNVNNIQIAGFEIMPAPYALAHSRVTQHPVFRTTSKNIDVSILLTDTMSDRLKVPVDSNEIAFESELKQATRISAPPVTCVIGNPPSAKSPNSTQRKLLELMMEDFKPPIARRLKRSNIQKPLRYESYNFLRWAAEEVITSGGGILALVLPAGLVSTTALQWARKWIQNNFSTILVLNLDEDLRTGESQGQSIFKVQQGRMILIAKRRHGFETNSNEIHETYVYYKDISHLSLKEKDDFLNSDYSLNDFSLVDDEPGVWAGGINESTDETWTQFWPLTNDGSHQSVFKTTCSGVKNGLTAPLVHTDLQILKSRTQKISRLNGQTEQIIEDWFRGQRKLPKAQSFSSELISTFGKISQKVDSYLPYSYRPFVRSWTISDEQVRASVKKVSSGARFRPEIVAAFSKNAVGIAVASSPPDLGSSLTRIASFAWNLPDNDIAARGSARIHCDFFPEEKGNGSKWDDTPKNNISDDFNRYFERATEAVFYVYAVISSNFYLNSNHEQIFRNADSQNPLRVPLYFSPVTRARLVDLGERLANLEDFDQTFKLEVKDLFQHEVNDKLVKYRVDLSDNCIYLIFDNSPVIRINIEDPRCLIHRISGHDIVTTWLRERQYAYLRRNFKKEDGNSLKELLGRLAEQLKIIDDIDEFLSSTDNRLINSLEN